MRSFRIVLALLVLIGAGRAADGGGFAELGNDKEKDAKKEAPAKDAAAAKKKGGKADPWEGAESPIPPTGGNDKASQALAQRGKLAPNLVDFAKSRGLAIEQKDGRAVRIMLIGGVAGVKLDELVQVADLGLIGLETWTGLPKVFAPQPMPEDERYVLAMFAKQGDRDAFLDARANGKDVALMKGAGANNFERGNVTDGRIVPNAKWWAVYASSQAAIHAFFHERGCDAPPWIHEGLGCELQRLVCKKEVRCYTFSYEGAGVLKMDGDWGPEVAKLIAGGTQAVLPANIAFSSTTVKIPAETYKQLWSLCTFLRGQAHNQVGPENKLLRTMCLVAKGTPSGDAVKQVYGEEDPKLTKAWHAWAAEQK